MIDPFTGPELIWQRLQQVLDHVPRHVREAYGVAQQAHAGQQRKEGTPYIVHPLRVALILAEERGITEPDVLVTALLHDVVEDSAVEHDDVRERFGLRVAEWIEWLTKPPVGDGDKVARDERYFAAFLGDNVPEAARLVKLADRLDNVRYLYVWGNPAGSRRYRAETRRWLVPLAEKTDVWFAHQLRSFVGDETLQPWEVRASEMVYDAQPWFRVVRETVERPGGDIVEAFTRIPAPDYVIVVPRLPDGRLLLLRGYKHGPRRIFHQFPAGYVDDGETPAAGAERELLEETGYEPRSLTRLGSFVVDGNREVGEAHLFLARDVQPSRRQRPPSDDLEQHEIVFCTVDEVWDLIEHDAVPSLAVAAAFSLAMAKIVR